MPVLDIYLYLLLERHLYSRGVCIREIFALEREMSTLERVDAFIREKCVLEKDS